MTHPSDADVAAEIERIMEQHGCGCEVCSRSSALCPATASSLLMELAEWRLGKAAALARVRRETWEEAANVAKPKHRHCMHKKCEGAWEIERMLRARAEEWK